MVEPGTGPAFGVAVEVDLRTKALAQTKMQISFGKSPVNTIDFGVIFHWDFSQKGWLSPKNFFHRPDGPARILHNGDYLFYGHKHFLNGFGGTNRKEKRLG